MTEDKENESKDAIEKTIELETTLSSLVEVKKVIDNAIKMRTFLRYKRAEQTKKVYAAVGHLVSIWEKDGSFDLEDGEEEPFEIDEDGNRLVATHFDAKECYEYHRNDSILSAEGEDDTDYYTEVLFEKVASEKKRVDENRREIIKDFISDEIAMLPEEVVKEEKPVLVGMS